MSEIKEEKGNNSVLNLEEFEGREYQLKIANECSNKNSLVVLPTGLGKTIIAVLVVSKILDVVLPNSKIIVLAPTRPLINQHYETFLKFLNMAEEKFAILTGKVLPEKRVTIFNEKQILFFTPQTLRNDLVNRKYTLKDTALIIYDEAHHASGEYPYTMIADEFLDHNPNGVSLALTASPGSSKKKITLLCENLHIPLENIHIRTRKDVDVKTYLKPMDIFKIGVNLTSFMSDVYDLLMLILEERLKYLSQLNFLEVKGEVLHKKVIRKDLLRLNTELIRIVKGNGDKTGVYRALSINAQALIAYHMLELVEQQGLDVLLEYLEKLNKDARKKNSSKANKILVADSRLRKIFLELKKNRDFSPENLIHPKYHVLVKVILNELKNNKSSRILVFVKLRNSVKNIVKNLRDIPLIEPVRFVGQATKSQDDKGLSQKRQIEILEQFKEGSYNVLVSTNVGEEGLDIAECDMVVFYDVVASEIRLIQRKGRTARHREGKVVILYCKETHDEIYLKIALSKLKRMNVNLKNPQQLRNSYSQTKINPQAEKILTHIQEKPQIITHEPNRQLSKSRRYQVKLRGFIEGKADDNPAAEIFPIKISEFPLNKFGLQKKLERDNISFKIIESDLHIIVHNNVLIQIFNPKNVKLENLLPQIEEFQQISSLVIIVINFIDFEEEFEGQKRILKNMFQEFMKKHQFHCVSINNEEELFFIIKNVINNPK